MAALSRRQRALKGVGGWFLDLGGWAPHLIGTMSNVWLHPSEIGDIYIRLVPWLSRGSIPVRRHSGGELSPFLSSLGLTGIRNPEP